MRRHVPACVARPNFELQTLVEPLKEKLRSGMPSSWTQLLDDNHSAAS